MNSIPIIPDDPPYGTERSYNGLRLAKALSKEDAHVTVFLMADAVACAERSTMKALSEHALHAGKVPVF